MQFKTKTWSAIAIIGLFAAGLLWQETSRRHEAEKTEEAFRALIDSERETSAVGQESGDADDEPALLSAAIPTSSHTTGPIPEGAGVPASGADRFRLRNSDASIDDLVRNDRAIVLNNAFIDTANGIDLDIPDHLRSAGDPGTYVVQASRAIDKDFRRLMESAGGAVVSYIPNNAYLVRMNENQVDGLRGRPEVQAVLGWEPYFKLEESLLKEAVENEVVDGPRRLRIVMFGEAVEAEEALVGLGATVIQSDRSPFGPVLNIEIPGSELVALAGLPEVQGIEPAYDRVLLNDRARARLGIAADQFTKTNFLELTGDGIPVNVNDSGVDVTHPDLQGRVFPGNPLDGSVLTDLNGHGTHVAGTIASSGENSPMTNGIPGSADDITLNTNDFRGMAPDARIYVLPIDLASGPVQSDAYIQEQAATRNYVDEGREDPIVSNNSWGYVGAFSYNSSAASYDQAVRDALPEMGGDQPIIYVFSAGNSGFGDTNGVGGVAGTIGAPGNAKNVITVGALDSFRDITNQVLSTNVAGTISTNTPFLGNTDSDDEITSFSSRGNTGIGVEGRYGRFKPDVVAPGAFTISTRSKDWSDPTGFSNVAVSRYEGQVVQPGALVNFSQLIPVDAVQVIVSVFPNNATVDVAGFNLPLYGSYSGFATESDFIGYNEIVLPDDFELRTGSRFRFSVGNEEDDEVDFDVRVIIIRSTSNDPYFDELKNLNDALAPHYRYESGTSMSAPAITGFIALLQQYLEDNDFEYSPALVKALLINGSRTVNNLYSFQTQASMNFQGWGLPNIERTLPASPIGDGTSSAIKFANQNADDALATGESVTWDVEIDAEAAAAGLRVSLVWTDPPGNPQAGIKLVNNLDLVVTDVSDPDNEIIYVGNSIDDAADYSTSFADLGSTTNDLVNNVENVFIREAGTNYTVTVKAARVNVNAVYERADDILQDFALVISMSDPALTNALTVTRSTEMVDIEVPPVGNVTNGIPLLNQRVGANGPLEENENGNRNQWHFYRFVNTYDTNLVATGITPGPYVAIATFIPPNLSLPDRNFEADIDMYVTRGDAGLLDLDPTSVANSFKSLNVGGSELITFDDSFDGEVFYVGIKAEDQRSAQYGFVALSSDEPFTSAEDDGIHIRGLPLGVTIEDGGPNAAPAALMFGVGISEEFVRSLRVTTIISHPAHGDLVGNLSNGSRFAVLNNQNPHFDFPDDDTLTFIYDDSDSGNLIDLNAVTADGPGSLRNFAGEPIAGLWIFSVVDDALTAGPGTIDFMDIVVDPLIDLDVAVTATVLPNRWEYFLYEVPFDATQLDVTISNINPAGDLDLYVRRGDFPTFSAFDKSLLIPAADGGGTLTLTEGDDPPLNPGVYYIGVFNPTDYPIEFTIQASVVVEVDPAGHSRFFADEVTPITDHAITTSDLTVPIDLRISDLRVGARIDHPRVSDLELRLLSPQGVSVLLSESRGGDNDEGYGISRLSDTNHSYAVFTINTNVEPAPELIKFADPPFHVPASDLTPMDVLLVEDGFEGIAHDPIDAAETIFARGDSLGTWSVGLSGITLRSDDSPFNGTNHVVLGGRTGGFFQGSIFRTFDTSFGVNYRISFAYRGGPPQFYYNGRSLLPRLPVTSDWLERSFTFRADTAQTRFEFRSLLSRLTEIDDILIEQIAVMPDKYYLPEEGEPGLELLIGERALGDWTLQVFDTAAGPVGSSIVPRILNWKIEIDFANPTLGAVSLSHGEVVCGTIEGIEKAYFKIQVPRAATAAVNIASSTGDIVMAGRKAGVPAFDPFTDDYYVDSNGVGFGEALTITTTDFPVELEPGGTYYLGLENYLGEGSSDYCIAVFFDAVDDFDDSNIPELIDGMPEQGQIAASNVLDYWKFTVSDYATNAAVTLTPGNGNVDLYLRRASSGSGQLPTPSVFDYASLNAGTEIETIGLNLDPSLFDPILTPGTWYVGIVNRDSITVDYEIQFDEQIANVVTLTNLIEQPGTNLVSGLYDYYVFNVPPLVSDAKFELLSPTDFTGFEIKDRLPLPYWDQQLRNADYSTNGFPGTDVAIEVDVESEPKPVRPGPWYLGVQNITDPDVPVLYSVRASAGLADIVTLTNDVPFDGSISWSGNVRAPVDYYKFNVTGLGTSVLFELSNMENAAYDLDLFVIYESDRGLPNVNNFDFESTNPIGENEVIQIVPNSLPVQLQPGDWYLAVVHRGADPQDTVAIDYTINALEDIPEINPLFDEVPVVGDIPGRNLYDYYSFEVTDEALEVTFTVDQMDGNVELYVRKDVPLPSDKNADYASENPGTTDEFISITPDSPVPLEAGTWLIAVRNNDSGAVSYRITADEFAPSVMELFNDVPVDIDSLSAQRYSYFSFNVPTNAISVTFEVTGATRDVDLFVNDALPLPDTADFDYASMSPGIADESITVTRESVPVPLSPGDWFISVYNNDGANMADYTIRAVYELEDIGPEPEPGEPVDNLVIVDTGDQFCLTWDAMIGQSYLVRGKVNVTDPDWTTIATVVADAARMTHCIDKPTVHQFFEVFVSGDGPVDPVPGDPVENLVVDVNEFEICLTWDATVGQTYLVRGKVNVADPGWTTIATVVADADPMTHCIFRPTVYQFFDVFVSADGPVEPIPGDPVEDLVIVVSDEAICLSWDAIVNQTYLVRGKVNIADPDWETIATVVAGAQAMSHCIDRPTQYQFFEVFVSTGGPVEPEPGEPVENLVIRYDDPDICLMWDSVEGAKYLVQGKVNITDATWSLVAEVIGAAGTTEYCIDRATTTYRFFNVVTSGSTTEPEPTVEVDDVVVRIQDNQICLLWTAEIGRTYVIEGKETVTEAGWQVHQEVVASATDMQVCIDPASTDLSFFRVLRKGTDPEPEERVVINPTDTRIEGGELCLYWDAEVGRTYRIEGKTSIFDTNEEWTVVAADIVADSAQMRFCLSIPRDEIFFQIVTGGSTGGGGGGEPTAPVTVVPQHVDGDLLISWTSTVGFQYSIQGIRVIGDATWETIETVTANDVFTTYAVDVATSQYSFFRVLGGQAGGGGMEPDPIADGSLDVAFVNFSVDALRAVEVMAQQPDGKILIGGSFTQISGTPVEPIVRLNADGSVDTEFQPGVFTEAGLSKSVQSIALQADGSILVGGRFSAIGGVGREGMARLNPDGLLDPDFRVPGGFDRVNGQPGDVFSIAVQPDGKIVVGGDFAFAATRVAGNLIRLNTTGSADRSFDVSVGADDVVRDIEILEDGSMLVAGDFRLINNGVSPGLAKLLTDGSPDATFLIGAGAEGPSFPGLVTSIAVQADGRIGLAGRFERYDGIDMPGIARLFGDGTIDLAFDPAGVTGESTRLRGYFHSIAISDTGAVYASGGFLSVGGTDRNYIARFDPDGTIDQDFVPALSVGAGFPLSLQLTDDGGILLGGQDLNGANDLVRFAAP